MSQAVAGPEVSVATKKASTSTRLPSDLVNMANVVASIENRSAIEVFDETMRPALTKLYKQALAKASKAVDKEEK